MAPPKTVNATQRFEFKASPAFFQKLDRLAELHSKGKRSQFLRECVEFLYENKSLLEASGLTSELPSEVSNG